MSYPVNTEILVIQVEGGKRKIKDKKGNFTNLHY